MTAAFERALAWIWRAEGGYSNDRADHGGPTNFGISQAAYPTLDIRALTRDAAAAIYRRDYWDACHCGELADGIAIALFDTAVNSGPRTAIRLLQQAAGVNADGVIGPQTVRAIRRADPLPLIADLLVQRAMQYGRIAAADYSQARFHKGWLRRLFELLRYLLESVAADQRAGSASPALPEPAAAAAAEPDAAPPAPSPWGPFFEH